jgi:hypothetical protein
MRIACLIYLFIFSFNQSRATGRPPLTSKCLPFECTSIAPGHAFQNPSHLNAGLLRRFSKCQPFEIKCISIASIHAFQNASHFNAPPLHQVMLFKMPAI